MSRMMYESSCPFCGKMQEIEIDGEALMAYNIGGNIMKCFPDLCSADRELIITGTCYECQERIFHTPSPGSDWGKVIGECNVCGCSIYERDADGKDVAECPQCHYPNKVENGTIVEEDV